MNVLACADLRDGPLGKVTSVIDGDTVVLESGLVVRLVGIQAPKLPLGRDGFEPWPLADEAKQTLEDMVLGTEVRLRYGGQREDRHGRALAHLFLENDFWVQESMLKVGLARVYSFADNRFCLAELYSAEGHARVEKVGIWTDPYYALRYADQPERLLAREGHYELVEGRVLEAAQSGSLVYLNFGRRWKTDFTLVIDKAGQRTFAKAGIDPLSYEGALIRVRGWIDERDGPRIEVTHPEQIEVLAAR